MMRMADISLIFMPKRQDRTESVGYRTGYLT